ncbi:MAG: zinc-finger domain-containing protein [Parvibaculaceae bacterium]|nr:zinc-finger domain-containing protein [Parvibaculaceae bacterium]
MASVGVPKFHNDEGASMIRIGVKEFECMGARPPHDHPHIYLDMGRENEIICPYCSTHYKYDPLLGAEESLPAGALHHEHKAA